MTLQEISYAHAYENLVLRGLSATANNPTKLGDQARQLENLFNIEQGKAVGSAKADKFISPLKDRLAKALINLGKSREFATHNPALEGFSRQAEQAGSATELGRIAVEASHLLFPSVD